MTDRWVVFFAYHFPPENVVGAARPYRFYKYLQRLGYRCHVISAADVGQVPELAAERVIDQFLDSPDRGLGWQAERAVRKLLLPGTIGTQWALHASQAALRFAETHRKDQIVLFSTFPPLGTHLAAWRTARRTGLPWIADYRDPLAGNPATARLGRHTQATYAWLDRAFVSAAGAVIANTDGSQSALQSRFPHFVSKIHLIWNGFDPEERVHADTLPSDSPRTLSHLGELYEGRTVAPLLMSFRRLIDSGRLKPSDVRIQLTGPAEDSCLPPAEFLRDAEAAGWLKLVRQQRPKAEAQQIARASHGLLIVQPHSAVQVPGKLFEYLQIGRPILAFVPRNSAIERLLAPAGVPFQCIYPDDPADVMDDKLMAFLSWDSTAVSPSRWFEDTFNAESQTAALARIIDRLLAK
jgi:hypothetical protein